MRLFGWFRRTEAQRLSRKLAKAYAAEGWRPLVLLPPDLHYGAIRMGRGWYATRFIPNSGYVEFWEAGGWHPYSIAEFQKRERAAGSGLFPMPELDPKLEEGLEATTAPVHYEGDTSST